MKLARLGEGPEIFHTIQGEGPGCGFPAVFIRTSRCNLHCVWCDTDYTWNFEGTPWKHEKDTVPGYAKHDMAGVTCEITPAAAARQALDFGCGRFVLTGGEPLLQAAELLEMIGCIRREMPRAYFEVETNGTRVPDAAFAEAVDQFNVSPKLANSGVGEALRYNSAAMAYFANSAKSWFKFVVAGSGDLAEVMSLCARFEIPRERVMLMPEGRTADELDRHAPQLAELCRDLGFRFCDRLHIRLWGKRRGV